jgi:hypothetical protein
MIAFLFIAFLALLLLGMDVFFSMTVSSYLGILFKASRQVDTSIIAQDGCRNDDTLCGHPLFILAGELMNRGLTKAH